MNELLKKYALQFGDFPPLFTTMSYDDPWYQERMKKALDTGKPITEDDLSEIEGADLEIEQPKSSFSSFKQPKKK